MAEGNATSLRVVFLVALGIISVAFQPTTYLNDEIVQGLALDGLAHGHVWINAGAPGYADQLRPGEGLQIIGQPPQPLIYGHVAVPAPGGRGIPLGSNMGAVLALPILGGLTAAARLVGPRAAVVMPLALTWAAAAVILLRRRGASPTLAILGGLAAAAVFLPLRAPAWTAEPTLEYSAGIFVSLLGTAFAAALFYDLVRGWVGPTGAAAATTAFVATPVLFWAETSKYSSLSVALLVGALWCLREGSETPPLRTALAYMLVGFAVWNQLPFGLMLGATLAIISLGAFRRGWQAGRVHVGAAIAGGVLGLVPFALSIVQLREAHLDSQYLPTGTFGIGGWFLALFAHDGSLGTSVFVDWRGPLHAAYATFAWTDWREVGYTLPSSALAPVAGASLAVLLTQTRRVVLPRFVALFSLLYVPLVFLLMGRQFTNIGGGVDLRYGLTFWPLVCLLATPAIATAVGRSGPSMAAWDVAFGAFGLLLLTIAIDLGVHAAHHNVTPQGVLFDQTAVIRFGGLVLACAILVAWLGRWDALAGRATMVAIGVGIGAQVLLLVIERGYGPWAAWPLVDLNRFLRFILFRHWPQYGI